MTDLAMTALWLGVLGAGLAGAVGLRGLGLPTTYVRDLLHVGAGVWVIGWPWWHGDVAPIAIVVAVAAGTALVPLAARRSRVARRFVASVAGGDERWSGLVLYTCAVAVMTALGVASTAFPAAAALLALALGDGIGGAVGRRFGRTRYTVPGGKTKTVEGSLVVWVAATAGVAFAAWRLGVDIAVVDAVALGAVAAVVEAAAPRGTDNALVPAAVWAAAHAVM